MKTHVKLTIVAVVLVILSCLVIWKDEIFKSKNEIVTKPTFSYTVIITNKRTHDTLLKRVIVLDHQLSSDSLKFYMVTPK